MLSFLFLSLYLLFKNAYSLNAVFWHVTDIHLNVSITNEGSYEQDSSYLLVKSAFDAMVKYEASPDFIIWNGDNAAHMKLSKSQFYDTLDNVTRQLVEQFPSTIILPSMGNHDLNPSDLIGSNSTTCSNLYRHWQRFVNESEATFKKGCYYSRLVSTKNGTSVRVIMLNTILWYNRNSLTLNIEDPAGQFAWLEQQLIASRLNKEEVFLAGHVPPGASEYSPKVYKHMHPRFNAIFYQYLQNYSDVILAGFFSHEHTDSFKIVYKNKEPVVPLYLAPSVSPLYLAKMGSINPSIRLYTWGGNTGSFYEQYHLLALTTVSVWTPEYNSTSMLPTLTAPALNDLLTKMENPRGPLFRAFFQHHLSGRVHQPRPMCSSLCHCSIICGMKHIPMHLLDACLQHCLPPPPHENHNGAPNINITNSSPLPSPSPVVSSTVQILIIAGIITLFTIILVAVVIYANKTYCHQRRSASLTRDIYLAPFQGKDCDQVFEQHIDHIAESTFGDVPEYRGHFRNNSRTILTQQDHNEDAVNGEIMFAGKSGPSTDCFKDKSAPRIGSLTNKSLGFGDSDKPQERYDYQRM